MSFIKNVLFCLCILTLVSMTAQKSDAAPAQDKSAAFFQMESSLPFATVKDKALAFIKSKGLTVFGEYDHAKNAVGVKLELPPTTVLVFGSPLVGTKLMQTFPGIGMELPLKILISQDAKGKVSLSYPNLAMAFAPYGVKADNPVLMKMQGLLEGLAKNATK